MLIYYKKLAKKLWGVLEKEKVVETLGTSVFTGFFIKNNLFNRLIQIRTQYVDTIQIIYSGYIYYVTVHVVVNIGILNLLPYLLYNSCLDRKDRKVINDKK